MKRTMRAIYAVLIATQCPCHAMSCFPGVHANLLICLGKVMMEIFKFKIYFIIITFSL